MISSKPAENKGSKELGIASKVLSKEEEEI